MKKFSIILLSIISICLIVSLFSSCGGDSENKDPESVRITLDIVSPFNTKHDGIFWLTSDLVADFDHVYDSIQLTATNKNSQLQQFFNVDKPNFSVQLTQGDYLLYMTSNRYINPRPIEKIAQFSARRDSVKVTASTPPIILNDVFTKQSLILIKKTGITGTPTVKVGNVTANMNSSANYWYAYTVGNSCEITTTVNAETISRTITTSAANIYLLSIAGASINIVEPFKNLIVV